MQFFAGVCMHMFRTCVVIHKQFVKCGTFDEALAMFRAAVKEAQNPEGRQCPDKGRDDAAPATGSGKDPAPEGDNAINGKDAADIYDESNEAGFCMEWCFERKQMVRVTHVKFRVRSIILWRNRDARGDTFLCNIYDSAKRERDKCHHRSVHELDLLPSMVAEFNNNTKKTSRQDRAMLKMDHPDPDTGTGKSLKKRKKAKGASSTKRQGGVNSPAIDFTTFQKREQALADVLNDDDGVVVAVGPYALRDDLANLAKSNDVPPATLAGWHEMRESLYFRSVLARQKVLTSQYLRRAMCFGVVGTSAFFSGKIVCIPRHDRSPPVVNHCSINPCFHNPVLSLLRW
jgi:hypothetical protein